MQNAVRVLFIKFLCNRFVRCKGEISRLNRDRVLSVTMLKRQQVINKPKEIFYRTFRIARLNMDLRD